MPIRPQKAIAMHSLLLENCILIIMRTQIAKHRVKQNHLQNLTMAQERKILIASQPIGATKVDGIIKKAATAIMISIGVCSSTSVCLADDHASSKENSRTLTCVLASQYASPNAAANRCLAEIKRQNATAENYLALANLAQKGVAGGKSAVSAYLEKAAELGSFEAHLRRCDTLYRERRLPEAEECFRQASLKNHAGAMTRHALMLRDGKGCEKNESAASEEFLKAALLGDAAAMEAYAELLGKGVPKINHEEAYYWMLKAERSGDYRAKGLTEKFARRISSEQQSKIIARADQETVSVADAESRCMAESKSFNPDVAFGFCLLAVSKGSINPNVHSAMAKLYRIPGTSREADLRASALALSKAAELGDLASCAEILAKDSRGFAYSRSKMFTLCLDKAKNGELDLYPDALAALSELLLKGASDVPQDLEAGSQLQDKACALGEDAAYASRSKIKLKNGNYEGAYVDAAIADHLGSRDGKIAKQAAAASLKFKRTDELEIKAEKAAHELFDR